MEIKRNDILGLIDQLRDEGEVVFLESQMMGHPASNKSFLAARPSAWIKSTGNTISVHSQGRTKTYQGNPWQAFLEFLAQHKDWMFGYIGYDLKDYLEDLESSNKPAMNTPDLFFFIPELLIELGKDHSIKIHKGDLPDLKHGKHEPAGVKLQLSQSIDPLHYQDTIRFAQNDIYEGEYYEINLSHPLEFDFEGDGLDLYEKMRELGPVPFGAYMSFDEFEICSSSPERFLARTGNRVWSQPIKGTAPKEGGIESAQKLFESEKERAENLMIVDLVRNDLNKVARKGTVQVSSLFEIQSFETVYQMVSTIECIMPNKTHSIELIKACFPMGSMTGAPKIAAMKAIENYETYRRGIYSGALGYFKPNGDFDLSVVIRTALINGNKLIYPVGGAITSDSVPEQEWKETILKAKAITNLLS